MRNKILLIFCIISNVNFTHAQVHWSPELIFFDDFSGNTLNEELWHPNKNIIGGDARSNADLVGGCDYPEYDCLVDEIGCSLPENIFFSNNVCELRVTEEFVPDCYVGWDGVNNMALTQPKYFKTGSIVSKRRFKYGTFEARVKMTNGEGFWPAFWLYGCDDPGYGTCGEIDIFEINTVYNDKFTNNWHHTNAGGSHQDELKGFDINGNLPICIGGGAWENINSNSVITDWHTYKVIWGPNFIWFYFDENLIRTETIDLQESMHIIFNVAVHAGEDEVGNCATGYLLRGGPISGATPVSMFIDYVKVTPLLKCDDIYFCNYFQNFGTGENSYFNENIVAGSDISNCNFNYEVENPAHAIDVMDFRATQSITLKPGFRAHLGSVFTAKIIPEGGVICDFLRQNEEDVSELKKLEIIQENFDLNLKIYPNPSIGIFNLDYLLNEDDNFISISVINNIGDLLFKANRQIKYLDLTNFPNGMYYVELRTSKEIIRKKIIKN